MFRQFRAVSFVVLLVIVLAGCGSDSKVKRSGDNVGPPPQEVERFFDEQFSEKYQGFKVMNVEYKAFPYPQAPSGFRVSTKGELVLEEPLYERVSVGSESDSPSDEYFLEKMAVYGLESSDWDNDNLNSTVIRDAWRRYSLGERTFYRKAHESGLKVPFSGEILMMEEVDSWSANPGAFTFDTLPTGLTLTKAKEISSRSNSQFTFIEESEEIVSFLKDLKKEKDFMVALKQERVNRFNALSKVLKKGAKFSGHFQSRTENHSFSLVLVGPLKNETERNGKISFWIEGKVTWDGEPQSSLTSSGRTDWSRNPNCILDGRIYYTDQRVVVCSVVMIGWDPGFGSYSRSSNLFGVNFDGEKFVTQVRREGRALVLNF